jgi:hypothetical protein
LRPRIGILSSYTLEPVEAKHAPAVVGLVRELGRRDHVAGKDYDLYLSHTNSLREHEAAVRRWLVDGVELLFSGGTPTCSVIRDVLSDLAVSVPVVYFGAHPIDGSHEVALERCVQPDTVCVRLELPLTYAPRNFQLLRRLFPDLKRVHIPFARNTAFCHPAMAERYDEHTRAHGPHAWMTGESVGFGSLRDLSWVIDCEYWEYPLRNVVDLQQALRAIPVRATTEPVSDVIVAFNDTYHVAGSPRALLDYSAHSNVPVFWVNNASMAAAGAVADTCNPFVKVAEHAARYVHEFLTGDWKPGRKHVEWSHETLFTLNRTRLRQIGVSEAIIARAARHFHEVIG